MSNFFLLQAFWTPFAGILTLVFLGSFLLLLTKLFSERNLSYYYKKFSLIVLGSSLVLPVISLFYINYSSLESFSFLGLNGSIILTPISMSLTFLSCFFFLLLLHLEQSLKLWKLFLWNCIFLSIILLFVVNDTISLYLTLELNMFSTLFLLIEENFLVNKKKAEDLLKYFLIQLLGSFFILLSFWFLECIWTDVKFSSLSLVISSAELSYKKDLVFFLFFIGLSFKLALAPFFHWFFDLLEKIEWSLFFLLIGLAKLVYIYLIFMFADILSIGDFSFVSIYEKLYFFFIVSSFVFGFLSIFSQISFRTYLGLSSLLFTSFILILSLVKVYLFYFLAFLYFTNYMLGIFLIIYLLLINNWFFIDKDLHLSLYTKQLAFQFYMKLLLFLLFLIVLGYPPFLNFWIKFFVLYCLVIYQKYFLVFFFICSILVLYFIYVYLISNILYTNFFSKTRFQSFLFIEGFFTKSLVNKSSFNSRFFFNFFNSPHLLRDSSFLFFRLKDQGLNLWLNTEYNSKRFSFSFFFILFTAYFIFNLNGFFFLDSLLVFFKKNLLFSLIEQDIVRLFF